MPKRGRPRHYGAPFMIRMRAADLVELDRLADALGLTRSEVVRDVIAGGLAEVRRRVGVPGAAAPAEAEVTP